MKKAIGYLLAVWITAAFISVSLVVASLAFNGWVLMKLWASYLIPVGLEPISFSTSVGLVIIFSILTKQAPPRTEETKPQIFFRIASQLFFHPLLALFFGWIFKLTGAD